MHLNFLYFYITHSKSYFEIFSTSIALVSRYFKSNRLFPFEWASSPFSRRIFYFRRNIAFHHRDIIVPSSFWLATHLRNLSFTKWCIFFPPASSIEFDTLKDSGRNQTVEKFIAHPIYSRILFSRYEIKFRNGTLSTSAYSYDLSLLLKILFDGKLF